MKNISDQKLWDHYIQINLNIVTTPTQLQRNLNTTIVGGWTWKWLCKPHHHPPTHTNSISAISQLLLAQFWSNFKGRFLGPSWTDSNCHVDICPGNNCPGDICPYQEYLSCYWPDSDQTLKVDSWDQLELIPTVMATFVKATFVLATFVHIRNISAVTDLILTKLQN